MRHEFYDIAARIDPERYAKILAMMESQQAPPWKGKKTAGFGNTAVVPIFGIIDTEAEGLRKDYIAASSDIVPLIEKYAADPKVSDILLLMDTPGGSCKACDDMSYAVQKAATKKNVEVFVDGLCCSAGIHIAAHASKITATPGSVIGSVGTICTYYDYSELFKNFGIQAHVLTTGMMKAMGVLGAPITEEQKKRRMELIQELTDEFKLVLMEHRKLTEQQVNAIAEYGDVWLADAALEKGLIDAIDRWDTFISNRAPQPVSPPTKHEGKMSNQRKIEILAACPGIEKDPNFLLEAVCSEKEISQVAAEWKEHQHLAKIAELESKLADAQKAKEQEVPPQPQKAPGGAPLETNSKEQPNGNPEQNFLDAIEKIQKEQFALNGQAISKGEASRILIKRNPGVGEAYLNHCKENPREGAFDNWKQPTEYLPFPAKTCRRRRVLSEQRKRTYQTDIRRRLLLRETRRRRFRRVVQHSAYYRRVTERSGVGSGNRRNRRCGDSRRH